MDCMALHKTRRQPGDGGALVRVAGTIQAPLQELLNHVGAYPDGLLHDDQRRLMRPITAIVRRWADQR